MSKGPTRAERSTTVARLRAAGMKRAEIAREMGVSTSYVKSLIDDPTGKKQRARREGYRGTCDQCGGATSWANGRGDVNLCRGCYGGIPRKPRQSADGKRRCACGTILNSYNTGTECGPCERTEREKAHAKMLAEATAGLEKATLTDAIAAVLPGTAHEIARASGRDVLAVRRRLHELVVAKKVTRRYSKRVGRGETVAYHLAETLGQGDLDDLMGAA